VVKAVGLGGDGRAGEGTLVGATVAGGWEVGKRVAPGEADGAGDATVLTVVLLIVPRPASRARLSMSRSDRPRT
jgi:hypothetical protein